MEIDHLIIFSDNQGREADELIEFGLVEGSSRVHPGQGTRNRKFYFENVFLEFIWVISKRKVKSKLTAPTRLWERANHRQNGSAPFGLCLGNTDDSIDLFKNSIKYKPVYLPEEYAFDIITNEDRPYLPWICRVPISSRELIRNEPTNHPAGVKKLTKVIFGIPVQMDRNHSTEFFRPASKITFEHSDRYRMTLEFDNNKKAAVKKFGDIPLTILH